MKKVCVYCGSSLGKKPEYLDMAKILAEELFKRNFSLVYGGAAIGLMGAVANAILEKGGYVIGVIPEYVNFHFPEMVHDSLTELYIVKSMHERKALMFDLSDIFIALPGGIGTTEEILEILTWARLGIHQKPCGLLNILGFYNHLISFLDHCVDQQFLKSDERQKLVVEESIPQLFEKLI